MESKHPTSSGLETIVSKQNKAIGEVSNRLSDIELKLDHIIERIRESLHRMNKEENDDWEVKP